MSNEQTRSLFRSGETKCSLLWRHLERSGQSVLRVQLSGDRDTPLREPGLIAYYGSTTSDTRPESLGNPH